MRLSYPMVLEPDDNGTLLVTFPDIPEAVTFGDDEEDALMRAVDALETMLAARMDDREDIPLPPPAEGRPCATLSAHMAARVLLYRARAATRDGARRSGQRGASFEMSTKPSSSA